MNHEELVSLARTDSVSFSEFSSAVDVIVEAAINTAGLNNAHEAGSPARKRRDTITYMCAKAFGSLLKQQYEVNNLFTAATPTERELKIKRVQEAKKRLSLNVEQTKEFCFAFGIEYSDLPVVESAVTTNAPVWMYFPSIISVNGTPGIPFIGEEYVLIDGTVIDGPLGADAVSVMSYKDILAHAPEMFKQFMFYLFNECDDSPENIVAIRGVAALNSGEIAMKAYFGAKQNGVEVLGA